MWEHNYNTIVSHIVHSAVITQLLKKKTQRPRKSMSDRKTIMGLRSNLEAYSGRKRTVIGLHSKSSTVKNLLLHTERLCLYAFMYMSLRCAYLCVTCP